MRGFDSKFIEELKNKNDIVDVIGKYVTLQQKGSSFWGRCPFHHEKTPSFSVNAQGQFFYCFGCHKSGDVISFIMEIESLDFNETVKFLAERAKIPLPEVKYDDEQVKRQKKNKERVLDLLRDTALFYVSNLKKDGAEKHIEYILKRKITSQTVAKFGIGASLDFNSLPDFLKSRGYTYEEMLLSGAVDFKNGRYFDALGGRLIIPIINQFNQVIAFVGRLLEKADFAKYKNTKDTIVFSKGNTLFNLNNIKKLKNEQGLDSLIVVEGHIDVISLVQAGFKNVVASMGTAFTKDQARIIKRYTDKVYISYDGDFAGQKAAIRGLEILKDEGIDVKVIALPNGMDPDDVVLKQGNEAYEKLIFEAKPLIDFKLDILRGVFDINTIDGKRKYISNAVKVIKESPSPAEQEDLLKVVRDLTGTTLDALKRELYSVKDEDNGQQVVIPVAMEMGDKEQKACRFILYSYLFNKPYAHETDLSELEFLNEVHGWIKDYIIDCQKNDKTVRFSDLYDIMPDIMDELSNIASMETDENKKFDQAMYFNDCIRTIKTASIDRKIAILTDKFKKITDSEERRVCAQQLSELVKEKKKIN